MNTLDRTFNNLMGAQLTLSEKIKESVDALDPSAEKITDIVRSAKDLMQTMDLLAAELAPLYSLKPTIELIEEVKKWLLTEQYDIIAADREKIINALTSFQLYRVNQSEISRESEQVTLL